MLEKTLIYKVDENGKLQGHHDNQEIFMGNITSMDNVDALVSTLLKYRKSIE